MIDNTGGVWECGHCHQPTHETHFYRDRATGKMAHEADPVRRKTKADRCGWRWDDDYDLVARCALSHGHPGGDPDWHRDPQGHRWGSGRWRDLGAIPPADETAENRKAPA